MKIERLWARSILDSRGYPTVEATVTTAVGSATASVPSGTSTGSHEAVELRDGDSRWNGKGVTKAVSHVNAELSKALVGKQFKSQADLDQALLAADGTDQKSRLGANAILAVSVAGLKAAAQHADLPAWQYIAKEAGRPEPTRLPLPLLNVINGGAHADNALAIQEFMLVPHGFDSFHDALRAATETFHALHSLLKGRGLSTGVGQEGGFAPEIASHTEALDLLVSAIKEAGYAPDVQISLALDVAASEFMKDGNYVFEGRGLTADQLVALYASMLDSYPLVSIEDPLGEDDTAGWHKAAERLKEHVQVVGDDLTVTNATRINEVAADISAVILKPNQIGTVTETFQALEACETAGLAPIISHRSGETPEDIIADLAVGWGAPQIKAGAPSRGERVAKYNRLLAIEQQLGGSAVFPGKSALKGAI